MIRILFSVLAVLLLTGAAGETKGTRYDNGLWFNGESFEARIVYVKDGKFVEEISGAEVIDLEGGYVIPPYCEGHNHNLAVGKPEERSGRYLRAGVFYAKIPNDAPTYAAQEKPYYARPETVDVSFAHGGLTGVGGHPVEILERVKKGGGYPGIESIEDHAYFEVGNAEDLEQKWPILLADEPDFIKVYLQFSEEYEVRKNDPEFYGNRGFDPALLPRILDMAHEAGLRVIAHVTSAHDFHIAVTAGVDEIGHLPGYLTPEIIDAADARAAAEKGIIVTTTVSLAKNISGKNENYPEILEAQKKNLQTLRDAGVTLSIGSDSWSDNSHREIAYLRSLDIFSSTEILKMWTRTCPASVFPDRQIGVLEPGYEASFLVLGGNPLEDFDTTRNIKLRVKQGEEILFKE